MVVGFGVVIDVRVAPRAADVVGNHPGGTGLRSRTIRLGSGEGGRFPCRMPNCDRTIFSCAFSLAIRMNGFAAFGNPDLFRVSLEWLRSF